MKAILLAAVVSTLTTTSASAALVSYNVKVFADDPNPGSPPPPLSGLLLDFDLSFDDSQNIEATTEGFTLNAANLGWSEPIKYAFTTEFSGLLSVGTYPTPGSYSFGFNENTAGIFLFRAPTDPSGPGLFTYTNSTGNFYQFGATIVATKGVAAVPEPATWSMMILGFGAIGYAMRRKTVLRFV